MGKRGPSKTPTKILKARGSSRGKARAKTEPTPPSVTPRMPNWFPPKAKTAWKKVVALLHELGLVAQIDVFALERYCFLYSLWRDAAWKLRNGDDVAYRRSREGSDVEAPAAKARLLLDYGKELAKLEAKFGMTPADRASLSSGAADQDSGGSADGQARSAYLA